MKIKEYKKNIIVEFSEDELLELYSKIGTALRTITYGSYDKFNMNVSDFLIDFRDNYIEKMMEGINNYG